MTTLLRYRSDAHRTATQLTLPLGDEPLLDEFEHPHLDPVVRADRLGPARGILVSLTVALVFWAAIVLAIWTMVQSA